MSTSMRENTPDEAQVMRDAPTYYPSATRDTAAEVSLRGGEESSGIDIRTEATADAL